MISVQVPPAQLQLDGVRKAHDPDQDYALSLWAALGALLLCSAPWALWWYAGYVLDGLCFFLMITYPITLNTREIQLLVVCAEQI